MTLRRWLSQWLLRRRTRRVDRYTPEALARLKRAEEEAEKQKQKPKPDPYEKLRAFLWSVAKDLPVIVKQSAWQWSVGRVAVVPSAEDTTQQFALAPLPGGPFMKFGPMTATNGDAGIRLADVFEVLDLDQNLLWRAELLRGVA